MKVASESYDDTIQYYGKYQSRDEVLADKRKFIEKRPYRAYRIRPGTLMVTCTPGANLCTATGTIDFSVSSTVKTITGVATFEYSLEVRGPGAYIQTENGKVLQRHIGVRRVRGGPAQGAKDADGINSHEDSHHGDEHGPERQGR